MDIYDNIHTLKFYDTYFNNQSAVVISGHVIYVEFHNVSFKSNSLMDISNECVYLNFYDLIIEADVLLKLIYARVNSSDNKRRRPKSITFYNTYFDLHSAMVISGNVQYIDFHNISFKSNTSMDISDECNILNFYDLIIKADVSLKLIYARVNSSDNKRRRPKSITFYNTYFDLHSAMVISGNVQYIKFIDTIFTSNISITFFGSLPNIEFRDNVTWLKKASHEFVNGYVHTTTDMISKSNVSLYFFCCLPNMMNRSKNVRIESYNP
ncbi:hypothetical protein GJ496_002614 [Pomphorhynchus laevis]|nr:hypothetical protein GJ496_002614 [Pomphorhynchus laevis]